MAIKLTKTQFIERSNIVHNNTYCYSKSEYISNKKLLTITCKIHGDFEQRPRNHMIGEGCPACGKEKRTISNKLTTEEFIEKSSKLFTRNDYSNAVITDGTKTYVNIKCTTHDHHFTQRADSHLAGKQGCKHCKIESTFSYSKWESNGFASKNFKGFSMYIIKCFNDTEEFIKIGKTYTSIKTRFQDKNSMPYKWILLHKITGDAITISNMEAAIHKEHFMLKILPKKYFPGHTECFSTGVITSLDLTLLLDMRK